MARCIIARRVSTDEQGLGMDAQLHACTEWAKKHGMEVAGVYDDDGVSGAASLDKRLGMMAAIANVKRGDTVLVAKRDRLGRDPIVNAMIESAISRKGGRLVSAIGEGTDGDDPANVLMRRMVDAFAEYERLVIKARTKAALHTKIRKGERVGRVRYGFALASDGRTLVEDPREQAGIRRMRELRESGLSLRQIGTMLSNEGYGTKDGNPWAAMTIRGIIERKVNCERASEPIA